ncbi:acyl-protein thioesterase 1 [Tothia fuscella]|uniref:Acyl-protein thioesterase 1 n=1 Tax=Tothia fuscella TaxID=1048955 RepID=A0A9P4NRM6_9PEZI|nr:acyl-protein thioesterase 1 [Tothia fuscella]
MSGKAALVVPAIKRHTATVIVAHGLGDSGVGWLWLAENWRKRNKFEEVKFVFPNAPNILITVNGGMRMPGWYDIVGQRDYSDTSLSALSQAEDAPGITRSQTYFHGLINEEIAAGIPSNRIVLGGFSQGGAMSLFAGLTCSEKLAGIFGLSSYMLLQGVFKEKIAAAGGANNSTKVFMGHGDADQVVRYEWGKLTAEKLKEWGHDVEFKTYPGLPHSADPEEIDDLEAYLRTVIPPVDEKESGQASK